MARTKCPRCGAPVDVVEVEENGYCRSVVLDVGVDPQPSSACYVVVGHNPLRAVRSIRGGQPDHNFDCPGRISVAR